MTIRILAIDPSLGGCAVATAIAGQDATVRRFKTKAVTKVDVLDRDKPVRDVRGLTHRYRAIADGIAAIARRGSQLDLILIEAYAYDAGGDHVSSGTHERIELGGLIRDRLADLAPVMEIAPNTLKSFAAGNGHASKDAMVSAMTLLHGYAFTDNDTADAMALLMLGLTMLAPELYEPCFNAKQVKVARRYGLMAAALIAEHERPRDSSPSVKELKLSIDPARIGAAKQRAQEALF
jgi:Holliday junction resolvasome RuvABC endonuclease subunit